MSTQSRDREAGGGSAHVRRKAANVKPVKRPSPIHFDPHRRAKSPELKAALADLGTFLERREADLKLRRRARREVDRRGFRLAVEALGCNLLWNALHAPGRPLAVPLSSGVMWGRGRYADPVFGQHFRDALAIMLNPDAGLMERITRGFRMSAAFGQATSVEPTPSFFGRMPLELAWEDAFCREPPSEVLILKGEKDAARRAHRLDYRDTAHTRRWRKEIHWINRHLEAAPFWLIKGDGAIAEDGQPIDPTRRSLVRVFNNGSWQQGGRLFGGFWESMPRDQRFRLLRIGTTAHPEGERIANVDFAQLFPILAYRQMKQEPPEGDLYDIAGDGKHRDGFKRLLNALLFATRALTRWPGEISGLFPEGTKLRDTLAAIRDRHAAIAPLFHTGIGFKLMLLESAMLIETLGRLLADTVTALPLHDSVLVGRSEADRARAVLADAFKLYTGSGRARLNIDIGE